MTNAEIYLMVTADLVAALDAGRVPWAVPFNGIPVNAGTLRPYSGINPWIAMHATTRHGWSSLGWLTKAQLDTEGLTIRRGESSTHVIFMNRVAEAAEDSPRRVAKWYSIFNLDQLAGDRDVLADLRARVTPSRIDAPIDRATELVAETGARIAHNDTYLAAYDAGQDTIFMPPARRFGTFGTYYATLFHELARWTGHPSRLARRFGDRFGAHAEAAESLTVELTAATLAHRLGLVPETRVPLDMDAWRAGIAAYPNLLVASASAASVAAGYLSPKSSKYASAAPAA